MNIVITGGAGFIGSNLITYLIEKYPDYKILNIDKLTYASNPAYLNKVKDHNNYTFRKIDITDRAALRDVFLRFQPDAIIHLAAESHVDNSISGPEPFVLSNVVGTFNLLEECRQSWTNSEQPLEKFRFHHVSTDEVYGSLGKEGYFTEHTPYAPNSPYSATKASSDFLVRAYHHTYGLNAVTTNCSNNFGPNQHDEKLIPTVIRTALAGKSIPVYGKGENIRDWLYVKDHCRALDLVFHKGRPGETYNIGGHNEWMNIELVRKIADQLNKIVGEGPDGDYKNLITFVTDRPGHDLRYAIDPNKIEMELGWEKEHDFDTNLGETVRWYVQKYRG